MRRVPGTLIVLCLAFGLGLQAQAQSFSNSPAAPAPPRLEVVGTDYTHPVPQIGCDPYNPYDPSCYPTGGGGPNYGSGTSNYAEQQ